MYANKYVKQDKPIYGWKLMEDGSIKEREPIYFYSIGDGKYTYRFKSGTSTCWIKQDDFDKFIYGRYYSFNPDKSKAISSMRECLENKCQRAARELERANIELKQFLSKLDET